MRSGACLLLDDIVGSPVWLQVLSGDLLGDISGEAARAIALSVYQKLGSVAAASRGPRSPAVRLPASYLCLAGSAGHDAAGHGSAVRPSGQAGSAAPGMPAGRSEMLHCCYACLRPGCMPSSQGAQALLATAWTDQRGALLTPRLLPCARPAERGSPTATMVQPRGPSAMAVLCVGRECKWHLTPYTFSFLYAEQTQGRAWEALPPACGLFPQQTRPRVRQKAYERRSSRQSLRYARLYLGLPGVKVMQAVTTTLRRFAKTSWLRLPEAAFSALLCAGWALHARPRGLHGRRLAACRMACSA